MRFAELRKGINVYDPTDPTKQTVVTSKSAARKAVFQTAFSRMVLAAPMIFPALGLLGLETIGLMPTSFIGSKIVQISLISMKLYIQPCLGCSVFPLIGRIKPNQFKNDDPKIQKAVAEYRDKNDEPAAYFAYNKGL